MVWNPVESRDFVEEEKLMEHVPSLIQKNLSRGK